MLRVVVTTDLDEDVRPNSVEPIPVEKGASPPTTLAAAGAPPPRSSGGFLLGYHNCPAKGVGIV